ncbi:hypothetical protein NEF87_004231 [Candidatus Lokiarchaeum ossiferum]|uniref:Phosphotyrosine protein phosphatase I domain-containing protein n=1 Tax=Candidatus Lokiarchaeum ossiferum TaxID=2951803 RepID=A0ABY6HX44_9ARCH|nr:hypothetical protein NEF87_004231 [Candidatus Lokiarchaeum sp. B-35]
MKIESFWNALKLSTNPKLIFVCLGNICRSPFAQMKFEQLLQQSEVKRKHEFIIQSGGFIHQKDVRIHPMTERALLEEQIPIERIEQHFPRRLRKHKEDLLDATALIVMAQSHRDIQMPAKYRDKTILLSAIALDGKEIDIPDPALIENFEEYKQIMQKITDYLKTFIKLLEEKGF